MLGLVKVRIRNNTKETLDVLSLPFVTRLAEGSKSSHGLVVGVTVVAVGGNLPHQTIVSQSTIKLQNII